MKEPARHEDRRMTTAEVCAVLGCGKTTLFRNWKEIDTVAGPATVKKIEHGKPVLWTETELALLLEKMKGNANNQHNLPKGLDGVETEGSIDLQIAIAERKTKELWKLKAGQERALRLKAEAELRETERRLGSEAAAHARTRSGLEMIQRIAEAAGLVKTDRDDVLDTYQRGSGKWPTR